MSRCRRICVHRCSAGWELAASSRNRFVLLRWVLLHMHIQMLGAVELMSNITGAGGQRFQPHSLKVVHVCPPCATLHDAIMTLVCGVAGVISGTLVNMVICKHCKHQNRQRYFHPPKQSNNNKNMYHDYHDASVLTHPHVPNPWVTSLPCASWPPIATCHHRGRVPPEPRTAP